MEGSVDHSAHNHHLDHAEADPRQLSSPSPPDSVPNLDPPPLSDDRDRQIINDELRNPQLINAQRQTLEIIDREFQNLVLEEKDDEVEDNNNGDDSDKDRREVIEGEEKTGNGTDSWNDYEDAAKGDDGEIHESEYGELGVKHDDNFRGHYFAAVEPDDANFRWSQFPVRPGADDCSFYMRTGNCKFGYGCKFNHPPRRRNEAARENVKEREESPDQAECKYYLRSGGCKFGAVCRYTHSSRGNTPVAPVVDLNFLGLPIRLGEKECSYYMRNGSCKYGSQCRFNHPEPTAAVGGGGGGGDSPSFSNGTLSGASQPTLSSWSLPRPLNENASFLPMAFSQPRGGASSSNAELNGHQPVKTPLYPAAPDRRFPTPSAFSMDNQAATNELSMYTHHHHQHQQRMVVEEFPERPDQPECSYYMKTGDCKFRAGCKFHHPKIRIPNMTPLPCALSDKGLPLRPDQNVCSHYSRYGICKFGPACKFDHPIGFAHSASSGMPSPDGPPHLGTM